MAKKVCVIDYGMGNIRSVSKALEHVGVNVCVSQGPSDIKNAGAVVVPGVGSFDHAVRELRQRRLFDPIVEAVKAGKPYLGLCLGLQLLFSRSDEGGEMGFGILPGAVIRFPKYVKTPHMGWNHVQGVMPYEQYYFVHSYFVVPKETHCITGWTDYGIRFASAIRSKNICATQFHPEKSQAQGLIFLKNSLMSLGVL